MKSWKKEEIFKLWKEGMNDLPWMNYSIEAEQLKILNDDCDDDDDSAAADDAACHFLMNLIKSFVPMGWH